MVHAQVSDNIYSFFINLHDWLYIYWYTNQTLGKSGRWTNYDTQTVNWYKTFSIKRTCFILYMYSTKGNFTCWHKGFKHASSVKKGFSGYLRWNSTISKRVTHLRTYYTENSLFIWRCILRNIFWCIITHVTSIFKIIRDATRSLIYYVRYIISWTNWQYYNLFTVWRGDLVVSGCNVSEDGYIRLQLMSHIKTITLMKNL